MIHKFKVNDVRLVLDVNSGAVHIIDELIWDLLDLGPDFIDNTIQKELGSKYSAEDLREGLSEIRELIEADMLYTSWDADDIPEMMGEPVIKAMCLHAGMTCNQMQLLLWLTGDFRAKEVCWSWKPEKGLWNFWYSTPAIAEI